jgi:hypothetical protein
VGVKTSDVEKRRDAAYGKVGELHHIPTALIPVFVTGIQSAQVLELKRLPQPDSRASTGFLSLGQK